MKVLIVDDDATLREMIKIMLAGTASEIYEVDGGKSCYSTLAENNDIELVITDIIMPDVDGIEVVNHINENYPHIKMIAISGGGRLGPDSYLDSAKIIGADDVLTKPFFKKDLLAIVERLFA